MVIAKVAISNEAPSVKDAVWAKPVSGGFMLYLLCGGVWLPLKLADDNETAILSDDIVAQFDKAGAAKGVQDAVVGTDQDDKDTMTLYGLKAYIDDAIAGLE